MCAFFSILVNQNRFDLTDFDSCSVPTLRKKKYVDGFNVNLFQFERYTRYTNFICLISIFVLFSDVGVLTYDAGAPSGGESTSICQNTPNC